MSSFDYSVNFVSRLASQILEPEKVAGQKLISIYIASRYSALYLAYIIFKIPSTCSTDEDEPFHSTLYKLTVKSVTNGASKRES